MTRKWDWELDRKNWTRKQQKERIVALFSMNYLKGNFRGLTAKTIATRLEQLSADYMRGICDEMVKEGSLTFEEVLHREARGGFRVTKKLYSLATVKEYKDRYEKLREQNLKQGRMF